MLETAGRESGNRLKTENDNGHKGIVSRDG